MYEYRLREIVSGIYGVDIVCDGNVIISQDYHPDAEGYMPMTESEACAVGEELLRRVS